MFFCLAALQFFNDKTREQVKQVAFEIGDKGRQGLDINNPEKKYTLNSMDGSFTALQLVSYMFVGFKIIDPKLDIGLDLSEEYGQALTLFSKERTNLKKNEIQQIVEIIKKFKNPKSWLELK